jgi:hypothetical protein
MSTPATPLLQAAYLREQRHFPREELPALSRQVDQAYIDIASKVNLRIIGVYPTNFICITGEKWYFSGSSLPQTTLRQVFSFTKAGSTPHNLNWASVSSISPKSCGTYTNGTNWYGVIYGTSVAIAGEVSFYVTPTNIVILSGAGAPVITSGYIVLEYLSNF